MSDESFDLPKRQVARRDPEVLRPVPIGSTKLTERQMDDVIRSAGQAAQDLGEIFKGLVNIAQTRASSEQEIARIHAQTQHIQDVTKTEIERIMADGRTIHTRGEAAHRILVQLTEMIKMIPDADASSRGRLIDTMSSILDSVLHEKKS